MKNQSSSTKSNKIKGQKKFSKNDQDDLELNPLLKIENKHDFSIETDNLLEHPDAILYESYLTFDVNIDKKHFDESLLSLDSEIIIILRYFEYLCTAKFKFSYIYPMLVSGLIAKDVFDLIKHALKNRIQINVPSFDKIFEPEIIYIGKIKY